MTTMHLGTLSPTEDDNKTIDLKQATFQVAPAGPVTPSLTPTSAPDTDTMAGKKLYSLEKPDDKANELASKLTLEEQVCDAAQTRRCAFRGLFARDYTSRHMRAIGSHIVIFVEGLPA